MCFVMSGRLTYSQGASEHLKVAYGQWICEASLWTTWVHIGTLQAHTECRLLGIDATRFVNIMTTFPTLHANVYATNYVTQLREEEMMGTLTDVGEDNEEARTLAVQSFQEVAESVDVPAKWVKSSRNSLGSMTTVSR